MFIVTEYAALSKNNRFESNLIRIFININETLEIRRKQGKGSTNKIGLYLSC